MSSEFCVVCGRTDRPLEAGVCAECFSKRTRLLQVVDRPTVTLCPTCGARQVGSHWERAGRPTLLSPEDLMPFLAPLPEVGIRRVAWEETGLNPLLREMRAVATVRFRGTERSVAAEFAVHIEHRTCPECSRKSGHFYTAILQLRGPAGRSAGGQRGERARLRHLWEGSLPEARSDWRRALSFEEERPEGWDFYLVDTVAARALARWLKRRWEATLTESPSLYGRKDGRDVYRVTFCLRVGHPDEPPIRRATGAAPPRRTQVGG